jgi:hypothetical protein
MASAKGIATLDFEAEQDCLKELKVSSQVHVVPDDDTDRRTYSNTRHSHKGVTPLNNIFN